jgi:hypothetical protein
MVIKSIVDERPINIQSNDINHHKLSISQNFNKMSAKFVYMSMQNSWASKCKNHMKTIYIYYFYINDVSFLLVMS